MLSSPAQALSRTARKHVITAASKNGKHSSRSAFCAQKMDSVIFVKLEAKWRLICMMLRCWHEMMDAYKVAHMETVYHLQSYTQHLPSHVF